MSPHRIILSLALSGLVLVPWAAGEEKDTASRTIRIGLSGSLFRDVPEAIITAMSKPFNSAMAGETGMNGELIKVTEVSELPRQLYDNSLQIGIFTGYEFAWARQKYPDLKPLSIAVGEQVRPQVFVIVATKSPVKQFGDLKGKTLSQPKTTRPHVALCLERWAQKHDQKPDKFFSKITVQAESTETLDDVVEGVSQAALVDNVTWHWYQKNKPGRTAKLRVAIKSEEFPATVVAYYPGNLDDATVQRFRQSMLNAHRNTTGKQLMSLWKMTGFQEVPRDYEQSLKDIVKAFPSPTEDGKK